jgi:site-specific DNA-methyltransferase (adenine-specific)
MRPGSDTLPPEVLEVFAGARSWWVHEGEALAVLRLFPDASIDCLATDSPYSSGGFTRGDRAAGTVAKYSKAELRPQAAFAGDNRDQHAFHFWCCLWLSEALRAAKEGAPVVLFTDWRQLPVTTDALQAGGWVWRGVWPWVKPQRTTRPQMGRFAAGAEFAVWGTKGDSPDRKDVGCLPGWIECASPMGEDRLHLTPKPVPVMERAVSICPPGGLVLDLFAGSGPTAEACLATGRRCIVVEQDPAHAKTIRTRIAAFEAGLPIRAMREDRGQLPIFGSGT